jgi:phenylacetate-CoA ligase
VSRVVGLTCFASHFHVVMHRHQDIRQEDIMDLRMMLELLSKRRQLRAQEHWTREQLEAHQTQALRLVREYAYTYSPFYQRFHKGLYDAPLQDLPVLTKALLMEHFDDLVTDRAIHLQDVKAYVANRRGDERFLGRYWVNATSGSSGHPGLFLVNRAEWLTMLASAFRAFEGAGIKITLTHRVKMAQIASTTPFHMSMQGGTTAQNWWLPIMNLAASERVETLVERLNAWQPDVILAYASLLRILADEQLAGRLQIAPRTVISGSEVLTQETRHRVVQAWGEVLFDMYGATECGLAAECDQHRGMHLMEDLVIVEVVDQDNRPVPPGVYGDKLLITVLFKRTQPLIRYEMSDSVRLSPDPCPCVRPFALIDDTQGRVEEVLSFPGRAGGSVNVQPLVFNRIMDTLPVSGWQVAQETDGLHVLLSGVRGELDDAALAETVRQALAKQEVVIPPVGVQRVTSIPKSATGKAPLIKSNL